MTPRGQLVGRDQELTTLRSGLVEVSAASGSLFMLAGEPGIGKSRLAAEAAEAARESGIEPAWGRCWEAGGAPTFWPWREVFDSLGLHFPKADSLAAAEPSEAQFALFREIADALRRATDNKPLMIVFEDLHAADPSTLRLLEFIACRLRAVPIMVIGTYRDVEARLVPEIADSLARIGRSGSVLSLARLAAAEVAVLVREAIEGADEQLVTAVFDTTHGNPLFVREVVHDIRVHGEQSGLPLGVREVIRQRLSPLSPHVRAVLEVCAVLGVELADADVARMIPDAIATLEDAVHRGVLVAHGTRLRFAHALYREALYYDLPPARRQLLHRQAAQALAGRGGPVAEIAHHWLEAGPNEAILAVEQAVRAAAHARAMFAFDDALAVLERARAAIPTGPDETALRCRVLLALGETKLRSGDATGRVMCVEAADMARALGDSVLLAEAGLAYGSAILMGGVDPVLVMMLEEALSALPDADSSLRARVMARLAAARQPSPPGPERQRDIDLGFDAIAMARRVADPHDLLAVLHAAAGVLYGKIDPTVRLPIMRQQEALAEQLGDTTRLLAARVRLAFDHLELGDYPARCRI